MEYAQRSGKGQAEEGRHVRPEIGHSSGANVFIDSMTLINRSYVYEFASEAYCLAHGRTRKEIVGSSVARVWGESNFNGHVKKHLDRCFAGNVVRYENWLESPGLGHRCYQVSYSPYFNDNGEVTHAAVASLDITDLRKEEEALEKSEPDFRTVVKSMHYGVYIFDTEGRFTFVNDVVVKNSGYPQEWYLGKSLFDLVRPEEKETLRSHFAAVLRGERVPPYEFAYRRAGHDLAWVRISATAIREGGHVVGVLGLLLDVTKRKRSEEALKESEEKYRRLFEESRDAVFITNSQGRLVDVNPAFERLFGYGRDEAEALNAVDMYVDAGEWKMCVRALTEKGFVEGFRLRLKRKDGFIMECLFTGTVQRDAEGAVQAYQGTIRDETEKNRVERAWRDTERTLQSVLAGSPAAQFAIDRNHRVIHWNRALELMTGVKAAEVMGTKDHWKGFYPNERPCMADLMVDDVLGKIPEWYGGKASRSNTVDGAYKATDFFHFAGMRGKWLCFTASAILDSHNEVIGSLETLEDVTPQRSAAGGEE